MGTDDPVPTHNIPPRGSVVNAEAIAQALACGRTSCGCGKRQAKGWVTHCPAHADDSPSLTVRDAEGGKVLVKDFGGCEQEAVIVALKERGLWSGGERDGLTLAQLAAAKGLPVAFLLDLGVRDGVAGRYRDPAVDIPYTDENGEVRAVHKRLRLTGEPRFIWRTGGRVLPYGLSRLPQARAAGRLVLVEGDSDCWTLWYAGIPALGVPGASTWRPEWVRHLQGIPTVYVWKELDTGGDTLAAKVAMDFPDIRIIDPVGVAKDPSALYLQDRAAFTTRLSELTDKARPASALRAEALGHEAREAFQQGRPVLEDPALLDKVSESMRARGFAGNRTPALLAYVAVTSRLLERPLNAAYIAASAAGKNRAIDAALDLMPSSAYHLEGAGSARALVYGDTDFEHKTVIVAEADSIPEDGPAASAIRALATDNRMIYDVVERDPDTGRFTVRHIVKPGPTGLITTSTKPLGEQLSTRLLTVSVSDTPEQTRAVLAAHAAAVNGSQVAPDVEALVAAQRWLELAGDRDVVVPFAPALAATVPADLVRMRRDFRQLLTVIQAVALLYQRQRERDADGRIVATLEDYTHARELLLDVFSEAATGGVSEAVRETAQAVMRLYDGTNPVSVVALADALGLHRATTWRRIQTALRLGFIVNTETRKRQPAKLVPGDPLPEGRPALPTPEEVESWGCPPHPETDATPQHDDPARYGLVSGEPVARPAATGVQQQVQPTPLASRVADVLQPQCNTPDASPRYENGSQRPPVALLHADPEEVEIHDTIDLDDDAIPPEFTGQRHLLIALGLELGFPRITWPSNGTERPTDGIPGDRFHYEQAARFFPDADIERAVAALEAVAAQVVRQ